MSLLFSADEIDGLDDMELRSKFFSITSEVRNLEGFVGQLQQVRMVQQQLSDEIGMREAQKTAKRLAARPRGPGF